MTDLTPVLIVAGIVIGSVVLVVMLIQNLLIVVPPGRVLVISWRSQQTRGSNTVGCRI